MAYLKPKKIKGNTYYYVVESKRINGKPRQVNQIYLGSLEQIIAAKIQSDKPAPPQAVAVFEFGIVATCFQFASKLKLIELIDATVPKRQQGLSIGQYLVIAAISRAVEPISKRSCWNWFRNTCLPRLFNYEVEQKDLTSQRFWYHMDKVPVKLIPQIEQAISQQLLESFQLDLRLLIYDTTNYYTFIDTFNQRNQIAERGKNKQKRNDLRQLNLALAVTQDFHIPLFHLLYEGNVPDAKSFPGIVNQLVERYQLLAQYCEDITLVFDKGNNSQDNQALVDKSSYHFIGAVKLNQLPKLAALPTDSEAFQAVNHYRLQEVKAYRSTETLFGKSRTVVVTFSPSFYKEQEKTVLRQIQKCQQALKNLQEQLEKRRQAQANGQKIAGKRPSRTSITKKVNQILKRQYMKMLFRIEVTEQENLVNLEYTFLTKKWKQIKRTHLGKTILFTDQSHWSTADIILGYRGQYQVETAFKISKRGHFITWRPTFHWTDQKLHVHAFYCMLSLLFASLAQRQVWQAGIEIGLPTLENELKEIKEVMTLVLPPSKKKKYSQCYLKLTEMSPRQKAIFDALELGSLAPNEKLGRTK